MEGKHPLVVALTGASGGLGIALVQVLEDELGCCVLPHVRNEKGRMRLEQARGKRYPDCVVADFSDEQPISDEKLFRWLEKSDVLINNAGIYHADHFVKISPKTILETLRINLELPLLLAQGFLKTLEAKSGGVIINISSGSGRHGGLLPSLPYALSKNGLNQMTAWLAREIPQSNVAIVAVAPTFITTPMLTAYRGFWRKLSKDHVPGDERDAIAVARDVAKFVNISYSRDFHGQTISI